MDEAYIQVPCGKCGSCLQNRINQWAFRIKEEMKDSISSHFVTLTYDESQLPYNGNEPSLRKKDLNQFMNKLRDKQRRLAEKWVKTGEFKEDPFKGKYARFYAIGEYGSEYQRPHYHILLFNVSVDITRNLHEVWKKGIVHVGAVEDKSITYVVGYMNYRDVEKSKQLGREPEFATMSKRPAIGHGYIERNQKWMLSRGDDTIKRGNYYVNMPRYYREKIFDEDQRDYLADKKADTYDNIRNIQYQKLKEQGVEDPEHELKWRNFNRSQLLLKRRKSKRKL